FDSLEAVLHRSGGSGLGRSLRSERRGLTRAAEAHLAGGSPGNRVAVQVGNRNDGVVERGTDVSRALLDIFTLTATGADSALLLYLSHLSVPLLTSSCSQWSSWGPCGYARWSWCAGRG